MWREQWIVNKNYWCKLNDSVYIIVVMECPSSAFITYQWEWPAAVQKQDYSLLILLLLEGFHFYLDTMRVGEAERNNSMIALHCVANTDVVLIDSYAKWFRIDKSYRIHLVFVTFRETLNCFSSIIIISMDIEIFLCPPFTCTALFKLINSNICLFSLWLDCLTLLVQTLSCWLSWILCGAEKSSLKNITS